MSTSSGNINRFMVVQDIKAILFKGHDDTIPLSVNAILNCVLQPLVDSISTYRPHGKQNRASRTNGMKSSRFDPDQSAAIST